jgi:hypothetical protein
MCGLGSLSLSMPVKLAFKIPAHCGFLPPGLCTCFPLYMIFFHSLFPKLTLSHPSECVLVITSSWKTSLIFISRLVLPHELKTNIYYVNICLISVSLSMPQALWGHGLSLCIPQSLHSLNKYVLSISWHLIRNSQANRKNYTWPVSRKVLLWILNGMKTQIHI